RRNSVSWSARGLPTRRRINDNFGHEVCRPCPDVGHRVLLVRLLRGARTSSAGAATASSPTGRGCRRAAAAASAPFAGPILGRWLPAMERARLPVGAGTLRAPPEPQCPFCIRALGAPRSRKRLGRGALGMSHPPARATVPDQTEQVALTEHDRVVSLPRVGGLH